jgi:hypothetical protein
MLNAVKHLYGHRDRPYAALRVTEGRYETMSKSPKDQQPSLERYVEEDEAEFTEMELLERLESLREDMEDLGVSTLAEVIQRIEELHQQLDQKQ